MIGIGLPQARVSGSVTASELATALDLAETAGFDSAWVLEVQLARASVLDPLGVLSFAAACTRSIRLGAAVLVLALHQPVLLARSLATLDRLSGGRTIVGLGAGGRHLPFEAFALDREDRLARLDEYLEVMRALWSGDEVARSGRFVALDGATVEPKPIQQPLPIWLGGSSRQALLRAARAATGWVSSGLASTAEFAETAARVRELVEQTRGEDASSFTIAKRVLVAIDSTPENVAAWFRAVYGRLPANADVVTIGDAAAVTERLNELQLAGAEHLIVQPVGGDDLEQLHTLAEDVLPALRPRG